MLRHEILFLLVPVLVGLLLDLLDLGGMIGLELSLKVHDLILVVLMIRVLGHPGLLILEEFLFGR